MDNLWVASQRRPFDRANLGQHVEPLDQLSKRGGLAQPDLAASQLLEEVERTLDQPVPLRVPNPDPGGNDLEQLVSIRKGDVVIDASAEKGVGQIGLRIAGQDKDRQQILIRLDRFVVKLGDPEEAPLDLIEQIVWEITRRLVDLVNQNE